MKVKIGRYPRHRWYHYYLYKWFRYEQKRSVSVHIDPWDTWSMDSTLAHIIVPMLKQLRDNAHGIPWVEDEDVPAILRSTSQDCDEDENFYTRWDYVINEMIFAFEEKLEDVGVDEFFKDGVYDRKAHENYQKRVSNGFLLFGKYYEALWD